MKTQRGVLIKRLRTDGHRSYVNNEMKKMLGEDGTLHIIRTPYCPNQNSIAERYIRTLVEMARTMLIHACMPIYAWEDAILHANYVRNRVITRALRGKTPYEAFWGRRPDLQWLKPFGCLVFVVKHKEQREGKFEAVAMAGVMLGISENHSGYRVQMLQDKTVRIARDVRFYEEIFPYRRSPSIELQWMNPMDVPAPSGTELGVFRDPFIQNVGHARDEVDKIELYSRVGTKDILMGSDKNGGVGFNHVVNAGERCEDIDNNVLIEEYGMLLNVQEYTIEDVIHGSEREQWLEAFKTEYGAIMRTGTFKPLDEKAKELRSGGVCKAHGTRPILTKKYNEKGEVARFKVRLVVQGYTMRQGIDYDRTFAPCARMTTIRMIVILAVRWNWEVVHSDVPNAYLNGNTEHTVIVKLPRMWMEIMGSELGKDGDEVLMGKSLYGAPDAGRNWNTVFCQTFMKEGYRRMTKEPCVFVKGSFPKVAIFATWVDDTFLTGGDKEEIE